MITNLIFNEKFEINDLFQKKKKKLHINFNWIFDSAKSSFINPTQFKGESHTIF